MEWRPQKEGIATIARICSFMYNLDGMETSKRRDCDRKCDEPFQARREMEWRPQKEGIATLSSSFVPTLDRMEWRPQKEGIATLLLFLFLFVF